MTMSFLLRLRCLLRLWILLVATAFAPPAIFAYDVQNQTTVAYDSSGESVIGYDAVSVLAPAKRKMERLGSVSPLPDSLNFLPQRKQPAFCLPVHHGRKQRLH